MCILWSSADGHAAYISQVWVIASTYISYPNNLQLQNVNNLAKQWSEQPILQLGTINNSNPLPIQVKN